MNTIARVIDERKNTITLMPVGVSCLKIKDAFAAQRIKSRPALNKPQGALVIAEVISEISFYQKEWKGKMISEMIFHRGSTRLVYMGKEKKSFKSV